MPPPQDSPLAAPILRGLSDKLYEKRKAAALQVEQLVRSIVARHPPSTAPHFPPHVAQQPSQQQQQQQQATADGDARVSAILDTLINDFAYSPLPNARNGGLIALAAAAIALGPQNISRFLDMLVPPIVACLLDQDARVRYYACESIYNVAKVARGEILHYFNDIFDCLSKLASDSEPHVRSGVDLTDRLIKDIAAERVAFWPPSETATLQPAEPVRGVLGGPSATEYFNELIRSTFGRGSQQQQQQQSQEIISAISTDKGEINSNETTIKDGKTGPDGGESTGQVPGSITTLRNMKLTSFNMPRFIPLLSERIHALAPNTRLFLVQWIALLDSIPDLELVSYLPHFLDGLFTYLSDPNKEVRVATLNLLAEFLAEIRAIVDIQRREGTLNLVLGDVDEPEVRQALSSGVIHEPSNNVPKNKEYQPHYSQNKMTTTTTIDTESADTNKRDNLAVNSELVPPTKGISSQATSDTSPLLGIHSDGYYYFESLDSDQKNVSTNDSKKSTGNKAMDVNNDKYVPEQDIVLDVGQIIQIVLQHVRSPDEETQATATHWISEFVLLAREMMIPLAPRLLLAILPCLSHSVDSIRKEAAAANSNLYQLIMSLPYVSRKVAANNTTIIAGSDQTKDVSPSGIDGYNTILSRMPQQYLDQHSEPVTASAQLQLIEAAGVKEQEKPSVSRKLRRIRILQRHELELMVDSLIIQFQGQNDTTRVAALDWLLMLHRKAPGAVLRLDDSTFQILLRTLSDSSEEVVKRDIRLLAQISESSDDTYLERFVTSMLKLFSQDPKLLEMKGAVVFKQLSVSLDPERLFKTFAEILLREQDLEFASLMVQNLNLFLITSPELAELRRKLKRIDTSEGRDTFYTLYTSWCHNAVAVLTLCLLAQQYEQASELLTLFADLDITVSLLVQVDKLVQLLESPVFTYLRMQLLEPARYPFLYKCLYGILMLLPQSSAFLTLRSRLNAVGSMMFLPMATMSQQQQNQTTPSRRGGGNQSQGTGGSGWNSGLQGFLGRNSSSESDGRRPSSTSGISGGGNIIVSGATSGNTGGNISGGVNVGNTTTGSGGGGNSGGKSDSTSGGGGMGESSVDWPRLLDHFADVQRRHERARRTPSAATTSLPAATTSIFGDA